MPRRLPPWSEARLRPVHQRRNCSSTAASCPTYHLLAVFLYSLRLAQILRRPVVSLGTPRDIVQIAEGVDEQDIDVGREQEEILHERVQHVPWVEEHNGRDEVETVCRLDISVTSPVRAFTYHER